MDLRARYLPTALFFLLYLWGLSLFGVERILLKEPLALVFAVGGGAAALASLFEETKGKWFSFLCLICLLFFIVTFSTGAQKGGAFSFLFAQAFLIQGLAVYVCRSNLRKAIFSFLNLFALVAFFFTQPSFLFPDTAFTLFLSVGIGLACIPLLTEVEVQQITTDPPWLLAVFQQTLLRFILVEAIYRFHPVLIQFNIQEIVSPAVLIVSGLVMCSGLIIQRQGYWNLCTQSLFTLFVIDMSLSQNERLLLPILILCLSSTVFSVMPKNLLISERTPQRLLTAFEMHAMGGVLCLGSLLLIKLNSDLMTEASRLTWYVLVLTIGTISWLKSPTLKSTGETGSAFSKQNLLNMAFHLACYLTLFIYGVMSA